MKIRNQILTIATLAILTLPSLTYAAWWNPTTWFRKPVVSPVPKVVQVATTTPATKTPVATTTSKTEKTKKTPIRPENPQSIKIQTKPSVAVIDETLTKEQIAIKMASDVEYANSPLDKATRQEIDKNWEPIKKYYTGKHGKNTTEGMYEDILDAYYKWKNDTSHDTDLSSLCAKEHEELMRRDPVARLRFCSSLPRRLQQACLDSYLPLEERLILQSIRSKPSYQIEQLQREVGDLQDELDEFRR